MKPKTKVQFTIEAPLMGYKQTTAKSMFHPKERARSHAYGQWKAKVLALSFQAGLPNTGMADREHPPRLSVHVFWKKHPLIDFKNVYGSIEDSCWYQPQGDRYVKPGAYSDVTWDSGKEEAVVTIEL